jgi:NADH:ubiquinone oxidoreductase subunit 2 (subunit N)
MDNIYNQIARRSFALLATLAFLVVSTIALAHGHTDAKSVDESHCAMCMAVHSATHVVATPNIILIFTALESPSLVPPRNFLVSFACITLNQDRAPPSL